MVSNVCFYLILLFDLSLALLISSYYRPSNELLFLSMFELMAFLEWINNYF